ncbi:hypothetical protein RvY_09686-2 [Ramazzottius varieornatus]|uniref:Uncharacterized protein n=1 Tax=Ramazzottius varieornatus TaxID=947166 RepID=A0A1D1VFL9_RAMVA|nr:hypothetical protein RvY_09686-2 [Ramazzottius varieornatus]
MMLHLRKWRWRWKVFHLGYWITALLAFLSGCDAISPLSFKFTQPVYNVSIPESPDGKAYTTPSISSDRMGILITDPGLEVRYRIISGDKRKIFRPVPRNIGNFCFLVLKTRINANNKLNRELDPLHELVIEATVKGHSELVAQTNVNVEVEDRNDLSPLFYPTRYSVEISEDQPLHQSVIQVTATDADVGLNGDIYYVLSEPSTTFAIHSRTGVISAIKRPDVDVQKEYVLTVIARDRAVKSKSKFGETPSSAQVLIQVRPVHRNAPFIAVHTLPSMFAESHPDTLASVTCSTDVDLTVVEESQESHNLNKSKTGLYFYVSGAGTPGQYYIRTPRRGLVGELDTVRLRLTATDKGIPPKSSSRVVNVSLALANEYGPKFSTDHTVFEASEGLPVGSFVAQVPQAVDGDSGRNGRITYDISTKTDTFRINNETGWIILAKALDREIRNIYELDITATDGAPMGQRKSATTKITCRITDENDSDPVFDQSDAVAFLAENDPAGHVVHIASARDGDEGDNAVISYSLANLNEVPFKVEAHTGKIILSRPLDYELDRREYHLRIRAADAGRPFHRESETSLIVKLQPKNDNAPFFRKWDCQGSAVMRPNTQLMTLSAIDPDEDDAEKITYKLLYDEDHIGKCFEVNVTSGEVRLLCGSTKDLAAFNSSSSDANRVINLQVSSSDGLLDSEPMWINITLQDEKEDDVGAMLHFMDDAPSRIECQNNPQASLHAAQIQKSRDNNARIDTFPHTPEAALGNRRTPKFSPELPAILHLDEDTQIGREVLQLKALDEDYGYSALLRYTVSTEGDYFRVTPEGQLGVARQLDRERIAVHILNITVSDSGDPVKSISKIVTVKILDKNDNEPVFDGRGCFFTVPEDASIGQAVGSVHATDPDEGRNGKVSYGIPNRSSAFAIHADTGLITVAAPLDYELVKTHKFSVAASDGAVDYPRTLTTECVIVVNDTNDAPQFPVQLMKFALPEDIVQGAVFAFVQTVDGSPVYSLGVENDIPVHRSAAFNRKNDNKADHHAALPFAVEATTGALSVIAPLDFESVSLYNFSIIATDKGQPSLSATLWVEVRVEDVDENLHAPKFKDFVTSASVLENQPADTFVTQVKAVDEDGDGIVYTLVGGSGLHLFRMDNEGTIRTASVFDRETQEHYWLKIVARDTAVIPKSSVLFVYVNIGDVNDNRALTAEPIYYTSVPENSPADTIVARLEAFDPDSSSNSQPTFKITAGNPQGFFTIQEKTGVIRTTSRKFDRETQTEHTLEVTISDNGEPTPLTSVTLIVVAVQDVQDSAVAFLKEHLQRYVVPSWKPPKALPLFRIIAFDTDVGTNAAIQFSLVGKKTENERYRIDAKTGEVFAVQALNVGDDYNVVVKASDPEDTTLKKTLRIVLEPSPIPLPSTRPPTILPLYDAQVLENEAVGHMVLLLEAEDPDGDYLWYYIVDGDPEKHFHIGPNSGSLIVARPLDWETRQNYTLTINVTDGVHMVKTIVRIHVSDVNEHRPKFHKRSFIASVAENSPPGTEVTRVAASDVDEDKALLYSIYSSVSPDSQSKFAIDENTGTITTKESLDRETTAHHTLIVLVKDRGIHSRFDLARVSINVIDMNDGYPAFRNLASTLNIPAGSPAGTVIATVEASDSDTGLNAEITYRLVDSQSLFAIDPVTGVIKLTQSAEKLGNDEVAVKVEAVDKGIPPLSSATVMLMKVDHTVRDKAGFAQDHSTAFVRENQPAGTIVAVLEVEAQSFTSYQLTDEGDGSKDVFTINPSTGVITTSAALDYEKRRKYSLVVKAFGQSDHISVATLTIFVTDLNDNPPSLNFTSIIGSISESSPVGSMVLDSSGRPIILAASDPDDGLNKLLSFSILESTAREHFQILPTGSIRLQKPVDYETRKQFIFHVQVSDSGQPPLLSAESAKVTIDVVNSNDCQPVFDAEEYNFTMTSPAFPNSIVGIVTATDKDNLPTSELSYKLMSGNIDRLFHLNSSTGVLSVERMTNESGIRSLVVQVFDGAFTATARVFVSFVPLDTSGPRFSNSSYLVLLRENQVTPQALLQLSIIGRYLNEQTHYMLLTSHPAFLLNSVTGVLSSTGVPLDHELTPNVTLQVEAVSIHLNIRRVARTNVTVTVTDANEVPSFTQSVYRIAIPYRTKELVSFANITALDNDDGENATLNYWLLDNQGGRFSVDNATGGLMLARKLSKEQDIGKVLTLRIGVADYGQPSLSAEAVVEVRVLSNTAPDFTQSVYSVKIPEDLQIGALVSSTTANYTSGNDSDAVRKVVYAIMGGDPFNNFDIDFHTGTLRLVEPVDYESQKQYVLLVRAMDPVHWEMLYSEVNITVDILDVNDHAPRASDGTTFATVKVSESTMPGSQIFRASFKDDDSKDNALLQYTLQWSEDAAKEANNKVRPKKDEDVYFRCGIQKGHSAGDGFKASDYFHIDPVSGVVSLATSLDRETVDRMDLTIIVSDSGHPRHSSVMTLRVIVKDVNDQAPCFSQSSYDFVVNDEIQADKLIGSVVSVDRDEDPTVVYEIIEGNEDGIFTINSEGGITFSSFAKGFLKAATHLVVAASDGVYVSKTDVNILPVSSNRYAPKCDWPLYSLKVAENSAIGTRIGSIGASDRDVGLNGRIRYSIVGDYYDDVVSIDGEKGHLSVSGSLDRESRESYLFWVQVTDVGGLKDFCQVNLTVTDVNDERPLFTRSSYSISLLSNTTADTNILKVEAADKDLHENGTISYNIKKTQGGHHGLFAIDQHTGTIRSRKAIKNGMENKVVTLLVEATDHGIPPLQATIPVEIHIVNGDHALPEFSQQVYYISIYEDSPVNTTAAQVKLTTSDAVTFTIVPPGNHTKSFPFSINTDGRIIVSDVLDADAYSEYNFVVAAALKDAPNYITHSHIKIKIIDDNDNAPMFVSDKFVVQAPENYTGGVLRLLPLQAFDADSGPNAEVRYELLVMVDGPFSVNQRTGWLTVDRKLDREAQAEYSLRVKASDAGTPSHSSTTTIKVEVLDIDDNPPRFPQSYYEASIQEEYVPETPLVEVQAVDPDQSSVLSYSIIQGDPFHHFMITSRGEVFVIQPLDRETKDSYELTISATDGTDSARTKLRVKVLDVNDNTPHCNKSSFREIIPENIEVGHVVLRMQAFDADAQDTLDYSFVGDGARSFSMDRGTGLLRVKTTLDREVQDKYALLGIAADHDGRSCTASVEIIVTDVNDMAPKFAENVTVVVPEDTPVNTLLHRIRTIDNDLGVNRVVRYSLLAADQNDPEAVRLFAVEPNTGFLRLISNVDREKTARYDLRVRAKDAGSPSLWSMGRVQVAVQNVRDDPPVFISEEYTFNVAENLPTGTAIGSVAASSQDDAVNEDITYGITDGNQLGFFVMDAKTGKITLNKSLDYEAQAQYLLSVQATESSDPPLTGVTKVVVLVTDVNDNSPQWAQDLYVAKINEDTEVGNQVLQVRAVDTDSAENAKVRYEVVNKSMPFDVEALTGWITVKSKLDRETIPSFALTIVAVDHGEPSLSTSTTVEISLTDVNDQRPMFDRNNYSLLLQEKRPSGFSVLRFGVTDLDLEPNGAPFVLSIVSGNEEGFFEVRSEDTSLRTAKHFDKRVNSTFDLVIRATDNGKPSLSTDVPVKIRVVEESQFPPKITPGHISILSAESTYAGGMIGRVTATDADIFDSLRFDIATPDLKTLFDIDAERGSLFVKTEVPAGQYDLNVSVTDGRFTTYEKVVVSISEVSPEILENSVGIQLDDVSVEEFVNTYRREFVRAVRQIFALRRNKDVVIISVQSADSDNDTTDRRKRAIGDENNAVDVLFAVARGKSDDGYHSAQHVREVLQTQMTTFNNILHTADARVIPPVCRPKTCVHGECKEDLKLLEAWEEPYVSVVGQNGQSYVFPRHRRSHRCICQPGYGGLRCEKLVNDCATRKCEPPKVCVTHGKNDARCLCPDGGDTEDCLTNGTSSTPTDHDAVSFNGDGYAWYDLHKPIERHLSLTMKFKTRYGAGNLMYVAGRLDYSILEIKHGIVQYRFDCGSGEGIARLEGLFVSDNQWHELSVQRHGRQAEIRIDGKYTAHATAPGINDILNLEGNDAFFGAEVPGRSFMPPRSIEEPKDVRQGFIGCMKHVHLNGVALPTSGRNSEATMLQMAHVERGCHISLDELGPCASRPCQNGGVCESISKTGFICRCPARFLGTFCENDSNPCASSPCLQGSCTNRLPNDYHCACPSGLTGKRCEYGRYCNPNPCANGGCEEGTIGPICQCFSGFEGLRCERDIDECQQTPCHNGATCENLFGSFRCNCTSQTRGQFCDEAMFIPNTSSIGPVWSWIEILVVVAVVVIVFGCTILAVLCRRRYRKRREIRVIPNDHTGSPSSQLNQINNNVSNYNEIARNKFAKSRLPDELLKRGSKISNLEIEARQPFLNNGNSDQGTSSINRFNKSRFRNPPLTPPPPSLSGASSETMSVKKSLLNLALEPTSTEPDVVKACLVDLPRSSSYESRNRRGARDDRSESQPLTSHPDGSYMASVSTSPMNSEHDDPGYSWDPLGTDFDTAEDTNADTAPTTASADGRADGRSSLPTDDRDRSISENESLLDADFAEDDLDANEYLESVNPPELFQDSATVANKAEDDYVTHSTISKRFSDYIPTAVLDAYMDEEKAKLGNQFSKVESVSDLHFEVDIPPSMPALEGYGSLHRKHGLSSLEATRRYVSHEALSSFGRKGDGEEEPDPETVSLLTGRNGEVNGRRASPVRSAWNGHVMMKASQPFSSLLGKQTQV